MGNIKSGGFLHVIAKLTSFGIFADNLGQQSHRDKFACQISTAGWLTTSCLYYSGGSDHLAVWIEILSVAFDRFSCLNSHHLLAASQRTLLYPETRIPGRVAKSLDRNGFRDQKFNNIFLLKLESDGNITGQTIYQWQKCCQHHGDLSRTCRKLL